MTSFGRKTFYTCILLISNVAVVFGQESRSAKEVFYSIQTNAWAYFETRGKDLIIDEVNNQYRSGNFVPYNQSVLNIGIAKQYYWIHFDIVNQGNQSTELIIDIDNARLNNLELFEVTKDSSRSLGKLGDFNPFYQRTIIHKNFLIQVSLPAGQKKDYFLLLTRWDTLLYCLLKSIIAKNFRSTTFKDYLFDGVTYGILLFVALLTLVFFIASRHFLYLYYGLYIITTILWFLSYFGLGYQYLWPGSPALNTSIAPFMAAMNILLNLQICQIFLRLSKTRRLLNNVANIMKCALVVVALTPFIINLNGYGYTTNHNFLSIFLGTILVSMSVVLFSVIFNSIKGLVEARVYLIASILKAGSIINLALLELGITPALYNMEGLLQIGIFIEIALLTYALARRYTSYKVKTFEKVIEAQERERSLISNEIHDSISNTLTGINLSITNFTRDIPNLAHGKKVQLEKIFDKLNEVQHEARNISHNTMPEYIKNNQISEIVAKYIDELQLKLENNSGGKSFLQVNFATNTQSTKFSEAVRLNIFRIIQEILTNVMKHAEATEADVLFSFSKKEMLIIAEDNGIGFTHDASTRKGIGIKNIRSRVALLDGSLVIKSPVYTREPGASDDISMPPVQYGTMIKIKIPYRNNISKNKDVY